MSTAISSTSADTRDEVARKHAERDNQAEPRSTFGNDLHTGARSFDFVGRVGTWIAIALAAMVISIAIPLLRGGWNFGIEFTGGSEFTISSPATQEEATASEVIARHSDTPARVSKLGDGSIRVQSDALDQANASQVRQELAQAYGVGEQNVAVSTIGPSWGADITRQMLIGLGIFLVLAASLMAMYFRTWKIALAAMLALLHDLVVTAGIYGITGVEVTPATVIGFLTILGYSLYDTVVVFDKVRENTADYDEDSPRTFGELVNLAVNQTLVRSINTSVVALLPVAAILFIGAFLMGAGTLRDISLALFIGILVGAISTIFLAAPLYALLRRGEREIRRTDQEIRIGRGESEAEAVKKTGGKRILPDENENENEDELDDDSTEDEDERKSVEDFENEDDPIPAETERAEYEVSKIKERDALPLGAQIDDEAIREAELDELEQADADDEQADAEELPTRRRGGGAAKRAKSSKRAKRRRK